MIVNGKWTVLEDNKLLEAIKGSEPKKWNEIASKLVGRTDTQVRYRTKKLAVWLVSKEIKTNFIE